MVKYIILFAVWAGIVIGYIIPHWLVPVMRGRDAGETAEAIGMIFFFAIVTVGWLWINQRVRWLAYVGLVLYAPSAYLIVSSFIHLKRRGKPVKGWEETTVLIDSGVYRIMRHPMYFGTALWAVGMALVQQSLMAIVLGVMVIICTFTASRGEDKKMIQKFGNEYREYMKKTPMWFFPFKKIP
jgi:protein-S-isoprenylcysteine O-methyltransferase Ste14